MDRYWFAYSMIIAIHISKNIDSKYELKFIVESTSMPLIIKQTKNIIRIIKCNAKLKLSNLKSHCKPRIINGVNIAIFIHFHCTIITINYIHFAGYIAPSPRHHHHHSPRMSPLTTLLHHHFHTTTSTPPLHHFLHHQHYDIPTSPIISLSLYHYHHHYIITHTLTSSIPPLHHHPTSTFTITTIKPPSPSPPLHHHHHHFTAATLSSQPEE